MNVFWRRLLLALMVVLLPLRSMAGDAMAVEMASGPVPHIMNAIETIAAHADNTGAAGHLDSKMTDCAGHGTVKEAPAASVDPAKTHCPTCTACQVCQSLALSPVPAAQPGSLMAAMPLLPALVEFASADAALSQKPPIL